MGGGSQNSTQTTKLPAWLNSASEDAVKTGQQIAHRDYTQYTGERVAGLSANEQQAGQTAASLSTKYQPLLDRASRTWNTDTQKEYMDPYKQAVTDINARYINQDAEGKLSQLSGKRSMMDAFGTDRGTMLEAQYNKQRAQLLADNEARGNEEAYNTGLSAFQNQQNQDLRTANTVADLGANDIKNLSATGLMDRSVRQTQDDTNYNQFLEKRDWDITNMGPLLNAIQGARTDSTTSTKTTKEGGGAGAILGLAATVVGAMATGGASLAAQAAVMAGGIGAAAAVGNG
jgi:hypothetical protein